MKVDGETEGLAGLEPAEFARGIDGRGGKGDDFRAVPLFRPIPTRLKHPKPPPYVPVMRRTGLMTI